VHYDKRHVHSPETDNMARILIVDDSPSQLYGMQKVIEKMGHEVLTATNGEEGVQMAKEQLPDLILMDVVMPELNGYQATRKISKDERTSHIPVIMVTTKGLLTDKVWGMRQGAKEYLVKPVADKDLIAAIKENLGS
jgi:twitching motility two-component system response regulator PilH